MRSPSPAVAALAIVVMTAVWGTTWAAIRISLEGIPPLTGVVLRFVIAGLLLVVVARARGVPLAATGANERWLRPLHALLSFCISYGVVFWAEQWVPSGLAAVLFGTFPLMVALLAHLWLPGERLSAASLGGTAIGFAGISVIYGADLAALGGRILPALVFLLAPLASAVANVLFKRWGEGIHPIPFNGVAMLEAAAVMAVMAWVFEGHRPPTLGLAPTLALIYMSVLGSALTFSLYFWLLHHMQARRLALIGYMTPVVALLVGLVFMSEPVTPRTLVGSALVVVGIALASQGHEVPETGAEPA